jgi:hypothetical protein
MPYDFSKEAELTNKQLAADLAKLTPLTEQEVNSLLPTQAEKQQLKQLIEIVNSSASQNQKVASLTSNLSELGSVVLKVLTRYLTPV